MLNKYVNIHFAFMSAAVKGRNAEINRIQNLFSHFFKNEDTLVHCIFYRGFKLLKEINVFQIEVFSSFTKQFMGWHSATKWSITLQLSIMQIQICQEDMCSKISSMDNHVFQILITKLCLTFNLKLAYPETINKIKSVLQYFG